MAVRNNYPTGRHEARLEYKVSSLGAGHGRSLFYKERGEERTSISEAFLSSSSLLLSGSFNDTINASVVTFGAGPPNGGPPSAMGRAHVAADIIFGGLREEGGFDKNEEGAFAREMGATAAVVPLFVVVGPRCAGTLDGGGGCAGRARGGADAASRASSYPPCLSSLLWLQTLSCAPVVLIASRREKSE